MPIPQAVGPLHSVIMPEFLADAAREAALHPATFIGILCLPNTAAYGKGPTKKHIQEAKDDILNKLGEPCNNFEVEQVTLQWDSSTMYSDIRPGKADWVVFISNIKDSSDKPVSEFHGCKPMVRTCLPALVPFSNVQTLRTGWCNQVVSVQSHCMRGQSCVSGTQEFHSGQLGLSQFCMARVLPGLHKFETGAHAIAH